MSSTVERMEDVKVVGLNNLALGNNSRYNDFLKRIIKIRTQYEER